MIYQYQIEKLTGSDDMRKVAVFVENLMNRLNTSQQDALWSQIKASITLWDLLKTGAERGVAKPEFVDDIPNAYGHEVKGQVSLAFAKTVHSDGGIGTVSTTLGHEMAHLLKPEAHVDPDQIWNAAKAPGATFDSVAHAACKGEAEAFYVSEEVRSEILKWLPDIEQKDIPEQNVVHIPASAIVDDVVVDKQFAVASLENQLVTGPFQYAYDSSRVFLAAMVKLPKEFCLNQDIVRTFNVLKTPAGEPAFIWKGPDGREFMQIFDVHADGSISPKPLGCNTGTGLQFEANLECKQALASDVNSILLKYDVHLLNFVGTGWSASLPSAWDTLSYDSTFEQGDETFATDTDMAYFLSATGITDVSFGVGTFQESLSMATNAVVQIDSALDGTGITLTRQGEAVRVTGADGQYVDLYDWATTSIQRPDGTSHSLVSLLTDGVEQVVLGSTTNDSLQISAPGGVVYADAGYDSVYGSESKDIIYGGTGDDYIDGGAGADVIKGGADNDMLVTAGEHADLDGEDGIDNLTDFGSHNTLRGGADNDIFWVWGTGSVADGGSGNDRIGLFGSDNTALGGSGNDLINNYGAQNTIVGGQDNDTIFDYAGDATIKWAQGDGTDTVLQAGSSTTIQFAPSSAPYSITASVNSNQELVLQASTGGSVTVGYWGYGANQVSVQTPDGSVWTSEDIAAQFKPATYSVTYTHGPVVRIEDAFDLFMSYCRPTQDFALSGDGRWDYDTRADNLALFVSQTSGGERVDESGIRYTTCTNSFTYTGGTQTSFSFQTDHGTFTGYYGVRGSVDMSWDRWTDESGQTYVALTHVSNYVMTQGTWMEPPTPDEPNWTQHSQVFQYVPVYDYSEREVTMTAPPVDHVVLGTPPVHASSMSLMSSELTSFAAASASTPQFSSVDSAEMSQLLANLFGDDTLAIWNAQTQKVQENSGHYLHDGMGLTNAPVIGLVGIAGLMQESHVM